MQIKRVGVYLFPKPYAKLQKKLRKIHKSFSCWIREKIEEEVMECDDCVIGTDDDPITHFSLRMGDA